MVKKKSVKIRPIRLIRVQKKNPRVQKQTKNKTKKVPVEGGGTTGT